MILVVVDMPAVMVRRLASRGWQGVGIGVAVPGDWQSLPDLASAEALPGPVWWLVGGERKPMLRPGDLLIDAKPEQEDAQTIAIAWQDSPYAAEYGFLLAVGGVAAPIRQIQPLLDDLAPQPATWLHAGGMGAPAFLQQAMLVLGGGWASLGALMMNLASSGFEPYWHGRQAVQQQLLALSRRYLASSAAESYEPALPVPPLFDMTPPNASPGDAPARKIAALIIWLSGLSP